jgi:hypothetical protein
MSITSIILRKVINWQTYEAEIAASTKQTHGKPAPIPPKNVEAGEAASQARMSTCISFGASH